MARNVLWLLAVAGSACAVSCRDAASVPAGGGLPVNSMFQHGPQAAGPAAKGIAGTFDFFDDFDAPALSAERWQYTIQEFWPPGRFRRLSIGGSQHIPKPHDFHLDGNTYVGVSDGLLAQYVNCSLWYDTVRTWPVWTRPRGDDGGRFFVYIWNVRFTPLRIGFDRHPAGTGHIGFLIALSDEYEQSFFHDRKNYLAIKGLQPLSIGFKTLAGTKPDPYKVMRVCTEYKNSDVRGLTTSRHADRYAAVGRPVDLSWVVSKEAVVARWKPSDEDTWQVLHTEASTRLANLRLRFAGSWCEFTVDAVQVTKQDLTHKLAP